MRLKLSTKTAIVAAALLAAPIPAAAQDDTSGSGLSPTGHWAFRWTRLYEDGARLTGGGIGLMLGERSRLELVGFGTASPSTYGSLEFRVAYGGVRLEREVWRSGRFVASAAVFGGGGGFSTHEGQTDVDDRTGMAVLEPEALLGFDVSDHLQLGLTGSYRWVTGIEGDILNRSDGDARDYAIGARLAVR